MTNSERYLALMRLAVRYGQIEIKWGDYSDPGKRPALEWSVIGDGGEDGTCLVLGMGRSMDDAVDEAGRRDDGMPAPKVQRRG